MFKKTVIVPLKASEKFTVFNSQSQLEVGGVVIGGEVKNGFEGKILGLKFNGIQILDEAIQKSKYVS